MRLWTSSEKNLKKTLIECGGAIHDLDDLRKLSRSYHIKGQGKNNILVQSTKPYIKIVK